MTFVCMVYVMVRDVLSREFNKFSESSGKIKCDNLYNAPWLFVAQVVTVSSYTEVGKKMAASANRDLENMLF